MPQLYFCSLMARVYTAPTLRVSSSPFFPSASSFPPSSSHPLSVQLIPSSFSPSSSSPSYRFVLPYRPPPAPTSLSLQSYLFYLRSYSRRFAFLVPRSSFVILHPSFLVFSLCLFPFFFFIFSPPSRPSPVHRLPGPRRARFWRVGGYSGRRRLNAVSESRC